MNKLKMAAVQERLKLKRVQIDTWTAKEKLCLASAVLRSGDQNWVSVSRTLRSFDELNRPPDWFSQKNCALQYSSLLEKVDTPKRKRGERGEVHVETPGESIVRKLTTERMDELKNSLATKKVLHRKLLEEIALIQSGLADDRLDEMLEEIEEEKLQKKREEEIHAQWLKEREEKLLEIKRAWKPPAASSASVTASSHQQRDPESRTRQSSSQSEQSSEAESLVDSPLSEPLQVDVIGDESLEEQVEAKPSSPVRESSPLPNPSVVPVPSTPSTPTPTSPLLTSLLKSPSQAPSSQASSILHSAITAQRGSSPTITSLLNSSPAVPVSGTGAVSPTVSGGIKNLATAAFNNTSSEDNSEKPQPSAPATLSPSAGAPTLSMLLELPPSLPGKPLPEIPSLTPKVPSTLKKESASPIPSPPASPQPSQNPGSDPPEILVPKKEEETENDIPVPTEEPTVSSDEQEKNLESNKKIEKEAEKGLEELSSAKLEKTDVVATTSISENISATISNPEPSTEVVENSPQVPQTLKTGSEDTNKEELPSAIPVKSETVEEPVKTDEVTKEAETEPTSESTSPVDTLQKKLPEEVEVQEDSNTETNTEEVSHEKSTVDEVSTAEATEKNVNKDIAPVEETSEAKEILPTTKEENVEKLPETVTEKPIVEEVESKSEIDDVPMKTDEVVKETIKEEKQPSATPELNEEPSVPEPSKVLRKDEVTSESAADEEEIEDKIRNNESLQSTPESLTPDSQIRRRGGGRGRKFRGRALAMYRMRQEKIAKAQLEKEKDSPSKAQESESETSAKESVSTPVSTSADEKDKSEAKKIKPVEDEISNLKSEWDEEVNEEAKEEEKSESGTSQKKTKGKKVEEINDDGEKKLDEAKNLEKAKIEEKTLPKVESEVKETIRKTVEMEEKVSEEPREQIAKTAIEGEKLLSEGKVDVEKKTADSKTADEPLMKVQEKRKGKEETVEIEMSEDKKPPVEKKIDEKKTSEKKPDPKSKQMPSEKKTDDKDRKKTKDSRVERKDKKVDEEKKIDDPKAKKEEESVPKGEEKKVGKERKSEVRDKKGLSEKRSEVVERKPSRERKSEEKDEKSSGERRNVEKAKKEPEAKKIEGERKLSRDRKSEEKEKKSTLEKKMEDVRKKSVDEKKTEETEKVKPPEKEVTASVKKSASALTPEKSKTPAVTPSTCGVMAEKLKRKLDSMDELSASEKTPQEEKKAKRSEEVLNIRVSESDKEMNESERKLEEDSAVKRKMDRRKGNVSRRLEIEESASKSSQSIAPAEEKERISEGENTPKSNIGRRRGGGSLSITSTPGTPLDQVPNSPASSMSLSEEERDYRAWKKAILLVWSRLATHKFASIFLRPITNDQAPGYHNVVFRPVDLYTIKKNVENGVIRTTAHFQRDVMLMFLNAIMYNSSDHDVHRMSVQMQQESLQHIQILLEASEAPKILRRETREGNKRSDSSSQMHFTPSASHDEASTVGVPALATSTHTPGISSVSAVPSSSNSVSSSSLVESSSVTDMKVGGINREVGPLAAVEKETTPASSKRKRTSAIGALQQGEERAAKKQRFHRSSAAENIPINSSEEEMSDSESQLSYIITQQKVGDSGDFSGESAAMQSQFQKDLQDEHTKKKKLEQERFLELKENIDAAVDEDYSAENSNSSDNEDEKMNVTRSMSEAPYISKKAVIKQVKDGTHSTAASCGLDACPDTDVGDEQLSSSQYEDHDHFVDEMEKKQMRRLKRSINESLSSSEDSSSIPDDGGYWPNVMSIKEEKNDDTESVTSSVYKRRRIQRKSTNSDPDSLAEAPSFPFSPNSASLEESDYQAWKRLILFIWDQFADHEYATIFMTPVRTDEAPRYYNVVYRPMDLGTIRKNVEKGLVRTISHFQRDVMLMFENALMYNPSHHDVHHKTVQMQKECIQYFQVLEQESSEDPEVFRHEIRESNNKIHSTGLDDMTTIISKSDSSSSEDQHLTYVEASGNLSITADSVKCSPLKEKPSMVNEKHDGNFIGKKLAADAKSSPAFSTRKRTSTFDTK